MINSDMLLRLIQTVVVPVVAVSGPGDPLDVYRSMMLEGDLPVLVLVEADDPIVVQRLGVGFDVLPGGLVGVEHHPRRVLLTPGVMHLQRHVMSRPFGIGAPVVTQVIALKVTEKSGGPLMNRSRLVVDMLM